MIGLMVAGTILASVIILGVMLIGINALFPPYTQEDWEKEREQLRTEAIEKAFELMNSERS